MEKVGILVVSYGSREAAMIDAFCRSLNYKTELYVADKQKNPFNVARSKEHKLIPDLDIHEIAKFARRHKQRIDFGIVGPEKPIIEGIRDLIEKETRIPIICPTRKFAIEASKVTQRQFIERVAPEANPRFKVFNPKGYKSVSTVKRDVYAWLDTLNNLVAVKPDGATTGKGVGVWGDHFNSRDELFEHFIANYEHGSVIIEEKVEGEESSFQAFCDGKRVVPLPETRDYKRAFDDDKGPNTGGMGSYKDVGDILPFMNEEDREREVALVNRLFNGLRKKASDTDLRGIPFYDAFIHTGKEPKLLENNSRPGDPEIQNVLPVLNDDFVDICYKIIEGNLTHVNLNRQATVVTYKVPSSYGEYLSTHPEGVNKEEIGTPLDFEEAEKLSQKHGDNIRIYPAAVELRNGQIYALSSRAVCVVGIADDIQAAREVSLEGIQAIKGGALWHRKDIASREHIAKSIDHMNRLRQKKL